MDTNAVIPLANVPFLDGTGRVAEVWWRFLITLFNRSGGSSGNIPVDISAQAILALEDLYSPYVFQQHTSEMVAGQTAQSPIPEMVPGIPSVNSQLPEMVAGQPTSEKPLGMIFAPISDTQFTQTAKHVTAGASPWTYTATFKQGFHSTGGTVTSLHVNRGTASLVFSNSQLVELSPGDSVVVVYTAVPTITIVPR